jgi:hypothetical protein
MEPENLSLFKQAMDSQATVEAMTFDGVKRENREDVCPGQGNEAVEV